MAGLIESLIAAELEKRTDAMYAAWAEKEGIRGQLANAERRHRDCAKHVAKLIEETGKDRISDGWTTYIIVPEGLLLEDASGRGRDSSIIPFE